MKTIFRTKTGNNFQKSISKSLAVITSIALVSISLNAQDLDHSLIENISFNETTLAMVHTTSKTNLVSTNVDAFTALTATENEGKLQLEDWMMNENNFSPSVFVETETESPMELENWMTNESLFDIHSVYLEVETEEELKLENWMLNEDLFSTHLTVDQPLELENWMISEVIWR